MAHPLENPEKYEDNSIRYPIPTNALKILNNATQKPDGVLSDEDALNLIAEQKGAILANDIESHPLGKEGIGRNEMYMSIDTWMDDLIARDILIQQDIDSNKELDRNYRRSNDAITLDTMNIAYGVNNVLFNLDLIAREKDISKAEAFGQLPMGVQKYLMKSILKVAENMIQVPPVYWNHTDGSSQYVPSVIGEIPNPNKEAVMFSNPYLANKEMLKVIQYGDIIRNLIDLKNYNGTNVDFDKIPYLKLMIAEDSGMATKIADVFNKLQKKRDMFKVIGSKIGSLYDDLNSVLGSYINPNEYITGFLGISNKSFWKSALDKFSGRSHTVENKNLSKTIANVFATLDPRVSLAAIRKFISREDASLNVLMNMDDSIIKNKPEIKGNTSIFRDSAIRKLRDLSDDISLLKKRNPKDGTKDANDLKIFSEEFDQLLGDFKKASKILGLETEWREVTESR